MEIVAPYRIRRVYDTTTAPDGKRTLRLSDRGVELSPAVFALFGRYEEWQSSQREKTFAELVGMSDSEADRLLGALADAGVLVSASAEPAVVSGAELNARFAQLLPTWLNEAFSHPFWERMLSGRGSARLFAGWLFELYHYTRNANRHMPLACAHTRLKAVKSLRAKHYAEEWNHYHYFAKALRGLGYTDSEISESVPLPATLAMSNFMRQAAREDVIAYSVCSAVLEGTTEDRPVYDTYHRRCAELYGLPQAAIQPIYDHLNLDVQYQHSNLFASILETVPEQSAERAARVLEYGYAMVEHIWMWTHDIERYYEVESNPVPRRPFDPALD